MIVAPAERQREKARELVASWIGELGRWPPWLTRKECVIEDIACALAAERADALEGLALKREKS